MALASAIAQPLGLSVNVCRQLSALYIKGYLGRLASAATQAAAYRSYSADSTDPQSIFVSSVDGYNHNSPILLGLVNYLERHMPNVGFFKPIAGPFSATSGLDRHVELVHKAMGWKGGFEKSIGLQEDEATRLIAAGQLEEVLDRIYSAYQAYKAHKEFVVVEGSFIAGTELDAQIAAALNTPALLLLKGRAGYTASQYFKDLMLKRQVFVDQKVDVLGTLLNAVPHNDHAIITSQLRKLFAEQGVPFAGAVPQDPLLASVRLDDVMAGLGASVVFGSDQLLDIEFSDTIIASQRLEELLEMLESEGNKGGSRPLVLTSMDRLDIVLGLLAAQVSVAGPSVAGVLLTQAGQDRSGRSYARECTGRIFNGYSTVYQGALLPVLATNQPLFEVSNKLSAITPNILPTSARKIGQAKHLFDTHIDINQIMSSLAANEHKDDARMTPKMFTYHLKSQCQNNPQHIILPEALDARVLRAAAEVTQHGLAKITLLGERGAVQAEATKLGVDISGCNVVHPQTSPQLEQYLAALMLARAKKGITREVAQDMLLGDVNFWGTMMVQQGDADAMVSGAIHTTASTIRPALQVLRSSKGLVSSVFFMCLPDKVLVYGDCAVNVNPSASDLAQIAITSAETATAFGIEPRVAMLSYSTMGSGAGPDVEKVAQAVSLVKQQRPDLMVEGPIQYDAAIDPTVAAVKIKGASQVAGRATVFVFPDLNTGNNTYKAVQQATHAVAMGPVMQGLAKPVNDLSRGCTVADIINTVCVTSIQAMQAKRTGVETA